MDTRMQDADENDGSDGSLYYEPEIIDRTKAIWTNFERKYAPGVPRAELERVWESATEDCKYRLRALAKAEDLRKLISNRFVRLEETARDFVRSHEFLQDIETIDDVEIDSRARIANLIMEYELLLPTLDELHAELQNVIQAQKDYPDVCSREVLERIQATLNNSKDFARKRRAELVTYELLQSETEKAERDYLKRRKTAGRLGRGWVMVAELNPGGFGKPSVWVKRDSKGIIIDRLVMKDSYLKGEDYLSSNSVSQYRGVSHMYARSNDRWNRRIPLEVKIMYDLQGKVGSDSVVRIRGWRSSPERQMFRMLLELCPFGDLRDIQLQNAESHNRIPEPFIWHTFECLATSGLLMERGDVQPNPSWVSIIHSDYKLRNVFLGYPHETKFPSYPAVKLGDFGLAFYEDDDFDHSGGGTKGHMAPEQYGEFVEREVEWEPMTTATNLWGVGIVIYSLMEGCMGLRILDYDIVREPRFSRNAKEYYSTELVELTQKCLSYDPQERGTFDNLMRTIQHYMRPGRPQDKCYGLRDAMLPEFEDFHKCKLYISSRDKWPMKSVLEKVEVNQHNLKLHPHPLAYGRSDPISNDSLLGKDGARILQGEKPDLADCDS